MNKVFSLDFNLRNIVLSLGISFYTFQQISYLVDSYCYETKKYTFIEYAAFVSFFPQLVAGPIVLHHEIIPSCRTRKDGILIIKALHVVFMFLQWDFLRKY